MHLKLTKHGRFCQQNNQLPTKSHDELKDNSITQMVSEKTILAQHLSWHWEVRTTPVIVRRYTLVCLLYRCTHTFRWVEYECNFCPCFLSTCLLLNSFSLMQVCRLQQTLMASAVSRWSRNLGLHSTSTLTQLTLHTQSKTEMLQYTCILHALNTTL